MCMSRCLLAGPFAGLMSIPVSFAVFRLARRLFCDRHLGGFRSVHAVREPDRSAWRGLRTVAHSRFCARSHRAETPAIRSSISCRWQCRCWCSAIVYFLLRSRHGLALTAIRDSEPASASLGVNTFRTKFIVYIATAACTGLIGGLIFLQKLRISPEAGFSINDWTVVVIFMVVIGGIGTLEGPFIGMLIYIILRELLADYGTILSDADGSDRHPGDAPGTDRVFGAGSSTALACSCSRSAGGLVSPQPKMRQANRRPRLGQRIACPRAFRRNFYD